MRELFIYYRLRVSDEALSLVRVQAFQMKLRERHPLLQARLLCQPSALNGTRTCMEIYSTDPARSPAGVCVELQADIEAEASVLRPSIEGSRHIEVFHSCAW